MSALEAQFADAVAAYAAERGITEVLHFTTNNGALGILATGFVLSRDRLAKEQYIEHIYTPNCPSRHKDSDWTDYVNLSISRVNGRMLGISSGRWHATQDLWWVVLAFDGSLLAHPDVHFVTTNNTYSQLPQTRHRRGRPARTVRSLCGVGLAGQPRDPLPWHA